MAVLRRLFPLPWQFCCMQSCLSVAHLEIEFLLAFAAMDWFRSQNHCSCTSTQGWGPTSCKVGLVCPVQRWNQNMWSSIACKMKTCRDVCPKAIRFERHDLLLLIAFDLHFVRNRLHVGISLVSVMSLISIGPQWFFSTVELCICKLGKTKTKWNPQSNHPKQLLTIPTRKKVTCQVSLSPTPFFRGARN